MNESITGGVVLVIIAILIALLRKKSMSSSNDMNSVPKDEGNTGGVGTSFPFYPFPADSSPASSFPASDTPPNELSAAPDSVRQWTSLAKQYAGMRNLPWRVVLAEIWQESAGNPSAVSSANARGLMQLKQIAVNDVRQNGYAISADWPFNATTNVAAGTAFLALQRKRTGNLNDAIKAYYQGYQFDSGYSDRANQYANEVLDKAFQLGYLGFA